MRSEWIVLSFLIAGMAACGSPANTERRSTPTDATPSASTPATTAESPALEPAKEKPTPEEVLDAMGLMAGIAFSDWQGQAARRLYNGSATGETSSYVHARFGGDEVVALYDKNGSHENGMTVFLRNKDDGRRYCLNGATAASKDGLRYQFDGMKVYEMPACATQPSAGGIELHQQWVEVEGKGYNEGRLQAKIDALGVNGDLLSGHIWWDTFGEIAVTTSTTSVVIVGRMLTEMSAISLSSSRQPELWCVQNAQLSGDLGDKSFASTDVRRIGACDDGALVGTSTVWINAMGGGLGW